MSCCLLIFSALQTSQAKAMREGHLQGIFRETSKEVKKHFRPLDL